MGNRSYLSQGDKDGLVSRYGVSPDDAFAAQLHARNRPGTGGHVVDHRTAYTTSDWYRITLRSQGAERDGHRRRVGPSNARVRMIKNASNATLAEALFTKVGTTISSNPSKALAAGTNNYIEVTRAQPSAGRTCSR